MLFAAFRKRGSSLALRGLGFGKSRLGHSERIRGLLARCFGRLEAVCKLTTLRGDLVRTGGQPFLLGLGIGKPGFHLGDT